MTKEQEEKKNWLPNPEGKGGFKDNPDHINRNGRPPKEISVTYWIKQYLEGVEPGHEKQRVRELAEKLVVEAFKGDTSLMREVLDRVDGKPVQNTNLTFTEPPVPILSKDVPRNNSLTEDSDPTETD